MYRNLYLLLPVSLLALFSCNSQPDQITITPFPSTKNTGKSSRSMPDSIASYQPVFGAAGTARQFPFGQLNQTNTTLRLKKVTLNGKLWITYQYDDQNRLIERTNYYTDGQHIYVQLSYSYTSNGLVQVASKLNKEAPFTEGSPKNNDLLPSRTIAYSPIDKGIAGLTKTTNTVFIDWYQKAGVAQSHLGFSPTGAYIWSGTIDDQGKRTDGITYRRNEVGNILWARSVAPLDYWAVDYFAYDMKPNPFRTTGDSEMVDMSDLLSFNTTNPNNVVTRQTINQPGAVDSWRYEYTYRPDGYPSQMKSYRGGDFINTVEYTYNQ
ncbi:hypothetical protein GO755_37280 [Spirosoma sp. HMF4905]|uniref:YD repeat-containing protein n=1 Tax=Spirosoma arboris TaxID=2682092 RepID=A0A7K1SPI5_9BACT|nr:hypothetical protein [Spirosoma arboris]MVM35728.1 hypothetical protein [Spirosoma arboris]